MVHDTYIQMPVARVESFGRRVLTAADVPENHAQSTTTIMLAADLRGIESHGIANLTNIYVRRLLDGKINPRPDIRTVKETAATALLDGDMGLGFVVAEAASEAALRKAEQSGAGMVSVRNSTHYGAGFYYALKMARRQMIGISVTTGGNIVVPPGAKKRTYGANVISVAAPTGKGFQFVLDGATSVVAAGKLHVATRQGKSVPQGWILDETGEPSTDPAAFFRGGGLLPLGSAPELGAFKGFGLGIFADVVSGVLSGFGSSLSLSAPGAAAHFFAAINVASFHPLEEFIHRMDELIDGIKSAERRPDCDEILIPGEPEARTERERLAAGTIPIHTSVIQSFRDMADELHLHFDLEQ